MTEANNTQANNENTTTNENTQTEQKGFFKRHGKKMAIGFGVGFVGTALYIGVKKACGGDTSEEVAEMVESAFSHFK